MLRIIQHKILNSLGGDKKDDAHWKEGMTAKRIKNALNEFTARGLLGGHFFVDEISDDLKTILSRLILRVLSSYLRCMNSIN
jgi:surfactin synthase thioesterase subunit